ncbi:MAG: thiamine phosphate synthase, partial [Holophaga sp.]|nr:thiamine phosphate synthase [Holophaga sp.]
MNPGVLNLPPLYPITNANSSVSLADQVSRLGAAGFPLVQFRGKPLDAKAQWLQLRQALMESKANGGWPQICVNDRADLAVLAAQEGLPLWGLHLGQDDLPPKDARSLPGMETVHIGTSTHEMCEWMAVDAACDHAGLGPFRATLTKGDHAEPIGLEGLRVGCTTLRSRGLAPVAIGGLTMKDADSCFEAGAESLAMIGEIERCEEPRELLWSAQLARWRARKPLDRRLGLVLIGGSGCGKSTLAHALSHRMILPLADLDSAVEDHAGTPISRIFAESGEMAFRQMEENVLATLLLAPTVIALGGGAWESERIRNQVRSAGFQVLWINENPSETW